MIRLLLVDSSGLLCDRLMTVLSHEPDLQIVDCVTTVRQAVQRINDCGLTIISANLPNDDAYAYVRAAHLIQPEIKILVVGQAEPKSMVIRYIEVGASGYVYTDDPIEQLLAHIRAAARGEALLAPDLASALIARLAEWAMSWEMS